MSVQFLGIEMSDEQYLMLPPERQENLMLMGGAKAGSIVVPSERVYLQTGESWRASVDIASHN